MIDITPVIGFTFAPAPRPACQLALVVEAIHAVEDPLAVDVLEALGLALVDRGDELSAVRAALSAVLDHSHRQHVETLRLRTRLADLLNSRRCDGVPA